MKTNCVVTLLVQIKKSRGGQLLLALAWLCFTSVPASALDPNLPPGGNFDLSHWYITLPDASATIITPAQLAAGYTNASWFYTGADGAMVFWCPVFGGTTPNSSYPRSELREMLDPTSTDVNWLGSGSHVLNGQCKVTQLPSTGKVIIGQIHSKTGNAYPLLKLVYNNGDFDVQVKKSPNSGTDTHFTSFPSAALNEVITYEIKLVDGLLSFTINGVSQSINIFQSDPDWANQRFYFKAGAYCQDNSGPITEGARVMFYQLTFRHDFSPAAAPAIFAEPLNKSVNEGATVSFNVTANGMAPLRFQWSKDGADLPNATNALLTIVNAGTSDVGGYRVVVTNTVGSVTSVVARLSILTSASVVRLGEALDAPTLIWTTNGTPPWIGQTNVTHDGVDAAQSGAMPDSGSASMQTTVVGPGTVSFWWKVSSEPSSDRLRFYLNGTEQLRITGEVDWERKSFELPAGSQVLEWRYSKNSSIAAGQDRGWVDDVRFGPTPPGITRQAVNQMVDAGTRATFSVAVTGTPPFAYRWQVDGIDLSDTDAVLGAATATLTLSNVALAQAGNYSVFVSNAAGSVTSSNALLAVNPVVPLAEALEAPALVWAVTGDPAWRGQTNVTHDGVDAAQSGALPDSGSAWMQTTVVGPGTVSFWWKVSSEPSSDRLRFYVNGTEKLRITGEVDWQWQTFELPAGSQVLEWRYSKNSSIAAGQDRGWVDDVRFGPTPPVITRQAVNQTVDAGTRATFSVAVAGTPPFAYRWQVDGIDLSDTDAVLGAATATLTLSNVALAQAGNYSVFVSNAAGSVTSSNALLVVDPVVPLAEALDAPALIWTVTGNPAWRGQTNVTHDGVDAAQSGAVPDSGATSMQTTVVGPGTVSFWWKVSSEPSSDRLRFYLNGTEKLRITGEVGWQWQSFNLSSGNQILKWTYSKNSSKSAGLDRGWVDEILFIPASVPTAPIIAVQPASQNVEAQTAVVFSVGAVGSIPLRYQWQFEGIDLTNGNGVSGVTAATLLLANATLARAGNYSVVVSNAVGTLISASALLTVAPVVALEEALDTPGWFWLTSGTPPWSGQTNVTHDGSDAARSGVIADSQSTSMQITVVGPGALSFWWKVSSEPGSDRLRFYLNGLEQARISGEVEWEQRTFNLPSGSQVLLWKYSKNSSVSQGRDRGWMDQVEFIPTVAPLPALLGNLSPPVAVRISGSDGLAILTWTAVPGKSYQVFYKDSFTDPVWKPLPATASVTGSVATVSDIADEQAQRFYQVVESD